MQRNFSSRGEAHPEAVASRMSASHKASSRPGPGKPFQRKIFEAWQAQTPKVLPMKPARKKG